MTIILTSDDFGLSTIYNEKILEMLESNYLTSTSVMVNRISAKQTYQINELISINKNNCISIGLHLELSEIDYINEIQLQFGLFEKYFGFAPDYIDIHKSNHFKGDYNKLAEFCNSKHIAFRQYPLTTCSVASPTLSITATNMNIEALEKTIEGFKNNKTYEIVFHIGVYDPNSRSKLNKERELDIIKLIYINQLIKQRKLTLASYKCLK